MHHHYEHLLLLHLHQLAIMSHHQYTYTPTSLSTEQCQSNNDAEQQSPSAADSTDLHRVLSGKHTYTPVDPESSERKCSSCTDKHPYDEPQPWNAGASEHTEPGAVRPRAAQCAHYQHPCCGVDDETEHAIQHGALQPSDTGGGIIHVEAPPTVSPVKVDILETDKQAVVSALLEPSVQSCDIQLMCKQDALYMIVQKQRYTVTLPTDKYARDVSATYEKGALTVTFRRRDTAFSTASEIEVRIDNLNTP